MKTKEFIELLDSKIEAFCREKGSSPDVIVLGMRGKNHLLSLREVYVVDVEKNITKFEYQKIRILYSPDLGNEEIVVS